MKINASKHYLINFIFRIDRIVSHDLYFKWLGDELPNATACLKASNKVTVREAYGINGVWVIIKVIYDFRFNY